MTVLVDDPLIAGMAITRTLPLHESSRRLRDLDPECPRVYGVAVMAHLSRRRWWPLAEALTTDRLRTMFDVAATETATRAAATQQLAATLAHVVIGSVVPLVVSAATQVPLLAGSSELTSMRRGQAVLDALVGFGLPVGGATRVPQGRPCLIRAALPILSYQTDVHHRTAPES